jgi:TPR repeat protein
MARIIRLSPAVLSALPLLLVPVAAIAQPAPAAQNTQPAPNANRDREIAAATAEGMAEALRRAQGGDWVAQHFLAQAYTYGQGVQKDPATGLFWMKKAADGGFARAQARLALTYNNYGRPPTDPQAAYRYASMAAKQGDTIGYYAMGLFNEYGVGTPRDTAKALEFYAYAAGAGNHDSLFNMGRLFASGVGVPKGQGGGNVSEAEAREFYSGIMYVLAEQRGYKLPPDISQKVGPITAFLLEAMRKQPVAGNAYSHEAAGLAYLTGWRVPKDVAVGIAELKRAAEDGSASAAARLGMEYYRGVNVPRDNPQAVRYFEQAAKAGNQVGYYGLGLYSKYGVVLPKDQGVANQHFKRAIQGFDGNSAFNVGIAYKDGLGLAPNRAVANYYFLVARQRNIAQATNFLSAEQSRSAGPVATPRPAGGTAPLPVTVASVPAGPRFALVIGNGDYVGSLPRLTNPGNDADLMTAALKSTGFQVQTVKNADQMAMKKAIAAFGDRVRSAGAGATAMFYYAGHGVQSDGVNFLIPVNAAINAKADLDLYGVSAASVLSQLEGARAMTNIIVLDACRNMPFPSGSRGGFGVGGLAELRARNGTFIAYSTAPGEVAADGTGRNSPFTMALAQNIQKPGDPVEIVFRNVRRDVRTATNDAQTPWDSSSLTTDFAFKIR